VAGVQVLYRSVLAGTSPVVQSDDVHGAVTSMTGPRRYISLVPTQLVRLLDNGYEIGALGRFDAVLVGGGPLDPRVRREAEAAGIRVVQTYGMSETCGGCVYDGVPLEGVAVRVAAEGLVELSGPVLFDGYEDEPERTASVLRDGWLRTDDLGTVGADGRLQVLGRADDVVISGGVKVPPFAVEVAVRRHPSVHEAVVVGVPDPEWGERVVVVVVPAEEAEVSLDELRELVTPRSWAPRRMRVVEDLPLLANGKPDRHELRRLAAGA
jgi:o-succinylbenzoate---CoA ligase